MRLAPTRATAIAPLKAQVGLAFGSGLGDPCTLQLHAAAPPKLAEEKGMTESDVVRLAPSVKRRPVTQEDAVDDLSPRPDKGSLQQQARFIANQRVGNGAFHASARPDGRTASRMSVHVINLAADETSWSDEIDGTFHRTRLRSDRRSFGKYSKRDEDRVPRVQIKPYSAARLAAALRVGTLSLALIR